MERKEFLSLLGTASAAFFAVGCFGGCNSDEPDPNPGTGGGGGGTTKVDFTIDLNSPTYSLLKTQGNAMIKDGIIMAFTNAGAYIAVSSACTHQGSTIQYEAGNTRFNCPAHGSNFNENGTVANGPATAALKKYNTALTGNNLRIFES